MRCSHLHLYNSTAQVSLADCLVGSIPGLNVDIGKATWWLRFCADRGFPPAMLRLAECYERGLGFKADQVKARMLLEAAAAAGADIPPEKLALYQREEDWGLASGDVPGFGTGVPGLTDSVSSSTGGAVIAAAAEAAAAAAAAAAGQQQANPGSPQNSAGGLALAARLSGGGAVDGAMRDARHEQARRLLAAAERGSVQAQYAAALAFSRGDGVRKDMAKAASWAQKAGMQARVRARRRAGAAPIHYASGRVLFFLCTASQISFSLGLTHRFAGAPGRGVHARRVARQGDRRGARRTEELNPRLLSACILIITDCETRHGQLITRSLTTRDPQLTTPQAKDPALAALWHRRAAEAGHPQGMLAFSRHLTRGRHTPRDTAQAVGWIVAAAEAGLPEAQAELGRRLLRGDGLEADTKAAAHWLKKCATHVHNESVQCSESPDRHRAGKRMSTQLPPDEPRNAYVRIHPCRAADSADPHAMTLLGTCHRRGWGVPRDAEKAVELYQAAAALGSALAMGQLGVCFEKGEGVPQDERAAAEWAREAAERGDPTGLCNTGVYLQHGIGAAPSQFRSSPQTLCFPAGNLAGTPQQTREFAPSLSALRRLAAAFRRSAGVQANPQLAVTYFRRAAEAKHPRGILNMCVADRGG